MKLAILAAVLVCACCDSARAQAPESLHPLISYEEQRYCGEPRRDKNGVIVRSAAMHAAFRQSHPCPVTGLTTGACSGWSVDHVIPLDCGGCDAVSNMQWLPNAIKSCAGTLCKDRWESRIYCASFQKVSP